jgi:c-di-GMP-binding flagellar brake protein YcgR
MLYNEDVTCIDNPSVIARIIARHYRARGRMCLSFPGDECRSSTTILNNNPEERTFLVDGVPTHLRRYISSITKIHVHASIGAVYTWFECTNLSVVYEGKDFYYQIPYPDELFQLQRRNAFRMNLPAMLEATVQGIVILADFEDDELPFTARLENLSVTGLGMVIGPPFNDLVAVGHQLMQSHIHIPDFLDLDVDLEVQTIRNFEEIKQHKMIGCQFTCLSTQNAHIISRCVMDLQRRLLIPGAT